MKNYIKRKKVGIVFNPNKPESKRFVNRLVTWLKSQGYTSTFKIVPHLDLLVVLGGDGTILKSARDLIHSGTPDITPILGVNLGQLGILSTCTKKEMIPLLKKSLTQKIGFIIRPVFCAKIVRNRKLVTTLYGINDTVIRNTQNLRVINLALKINRTRLTEYAGDGIIVSTATGSTAYNMAANGPLSLPTVPIFIVTPICPHHLNLRSLIVNDTDEIAIQVRSGSVDCMLSVDGQQHFPVQVNDRINITKTEFQCRFVLKTTNSTGIEFLTHKLNYGISHLKT